jgi:hypothetical protein
MIAKTRFVAFVAAAIAGMGALSTPASAQTGGGPGNPYTVRDIVADETGGSQAEARAQGVAKAKAAGAQRLIERLTLPEDRASIDIAAISRTAGAQNSQAPDRFAGNRYLGLLAITYTGSSVREMLNGKGVPFVDTQEGLAVLVPTTQGLDLNGWLNAWSYKAADGAVLGRSDNTVLAPYVASVGPRPGRPSWADLQGEVASAKATHAVIVEASGSPSQIMLRISELRDGSQETVVATSGPYPDFEAARLGAVSEMETAWKKASIVRTSGSSDLALAAHFSGVAQWVKIRKALEGSRLVTSMVVESFSATGADMKLAYSGRPDQLSADLRARGLSLAQDGGGWVLQAQ